MVDTRSVKLFYSYSHKDELLRDDLEAHLRLLQRQGLIKTWHDRKIGVGTEWNQVIDDNLENADIILLLISADFLGSDYCWGVEIKRALQRHDENSAVVIPVSLRECDKTNADFMKLQGLPKDFKPVTTWANRDEAFTDIARGIRAAVEEIRKKSKGEKRPNIFNVPIPRNSLFTGRDKILMELHKLFEGEHHLYLKSSPKAAALSGLGGVGKTQTVSEYAYRYQAEYFAVLWVSADGTDLLHNSFAQLAPLLGITEEKQPEQIRAVQSWLCEHQRWLLIIDNAETFGELTAARSLLPPNANGHVLFTTRAQSTGNLFALQISSFDNETGALFLLRRSKYVDMRLDNLEEIRQLITNDDWQTAMALTHELGGLALAIDQAGAYIEQTGCGLDGYLERYRNNAPAMLKDRGYVHSDDHPVAVYKTFLLALENAESRHPLAGNILRDCALLHPDGISEKLYRNYDPLDLDKALSALKDYSLIHRERGKDVFTIHRLVQVVVRDVCDG